MKEKSKIIVNYLPQYHVIPENDKWWGKGFTDWEAVKNAKPLFKGHIQPKMPINGDYYFLDNPNEIRKQVKIARKYGIYGFGIYHYWFNSELQLLQKPAEIILQNKDININFLFLWDNATWKRTWSNVKHANDWSPQNDNPEKQTGTGILAELIYGTKEDWKYHFDYLLPFFKDDRYIKIDNKPVFGFFQPINNFETIKKMANYWDELAKENGFGGILCMTRDNYNGLNLDYSFRYTPLVPTNKITYIKYKLKDVIASKTGKIRFYDYDRCWQEILREAKKSNNHTFLSGFVKFDDTPRRGNNGRVIQGSTPLKFEKYVKELINISTEQGKKFLFLTAWNEWGEGAYFEPDTDEGYAYLEALERAVKDEI